MPILPGRPYSGLCGFTDIVKGRNIIATLVSGGTSGGGYSALVSTNVTNNDFTFNALDNPIVPIVPIVPSAQIPLVLTFFVNEPNGIVKLDFYLNGTDNIVIDWGDTKTTSYTATTYLADISAGEHTYDLSGNYTVSVSGLLTGFNGVRNEISADYLTEIKSWGTLGIISLDFACNYILNIPIPTSIPTTVRSMNSMFINSGYTGNDIRGWNVSNVTDMNNCFRTSLFNGDISRWFASESYTGLIDVSMNEMFLAGEMAGGYQGYTQDLSNWLVRSTNHSRFNLSLTNNQDYIKLPTFVDGRQPTNLSATTDISSATLTWTNNTSGTSYIRVQYKLSTSSWTTGTTVIFDGGTTAIIRNLLSATTYDFRVAGVDTTDGWTINTLVTATTRTAPPTNLYAVPISTTSIQLSWNNVSTPTDTRIEKLTNSTWTIVPHALLGSASTYTVIDLSAATSYNFRITTLVGSVESTPITVTGFTKPNAPSNLSGYAIDTSTIYLDWSNNSVPESTRITWTDSNQNIIGDLSSCIIRNLNPGTLYSFTAQTYKNILSDFSNIASVATKPNAPTNVTIENNEYSITNNSMILIWTGETPPNSLIEYELAGGNWSNSLFSNEIEVRNLVAATAYQFRVYNILNNVQSAPSSVITRYTRPNASTDLSAVPINPVSIQFRWINRSSGTTTIEYALDTSPTWTTFTGSIVDSSAVITGLEPEFLYKFRVLTVANGLTATSVEVRARTYAIAPSALEANAIDSFSVDLGWTNNSIPIDTIIQYSLDGLTWTTVVHLPLGEATHYCVTGLNRDTTYRFRIATVTATTISLYVGEAIAITLLLSPTDLSGFAIDSSSVFLSWTNKEIPTSTTVSLLKGEALTDLIEFTGDVSGGIVRDISAGINTFAVYTIVGSKTSGYSNFANIAVYPPAPTDLLATPLLTGLLLGWTNNVVADDTIIEYKLDTSSTWTTFQHAELGDAQSYTLTGLTNSLYDFRISTVKNGLSSTPSTTQATPEAYPPAPSNLRGTTPSTGQIALAWDNNIVADDTIIEYKLDTSSTWIISEHTPLSNIESYVVTNLEIDSLYDFRVSTVKNGQTSTPSLIISITPGIYT